ncbi:hypothetical protein HOF56_03105 [Candidatus Peribacteria bacterium]|jgi:hypothetical protein|nr:hypothetical protein [Candidatus Peribacteria bacterium]MBT4021021.1 hypothetical protein [Candidatus Peribacteria bacterium]MBT4240919.1 hypothetical protein [Candidatus Peribacteria bacterium]MBT4474563.1 hypothetical protein [Candidatus Peribacteria bacterium]
MEDYPDLGKEEMLRAIFNRRLEGKIIGISGEVIFAVFFVMGMPIEMPLSKSAFPKGAVLKKDDHIVMRRGKARVVTIKPLSPSDFVSRTSSKEKVNLKKILESPSGSLVLN